MSQKIVIVDHPGYVERYEGFVVPGLHGVGDVDGNPATIVTTEAGDYLAVHSRHVYTPEGLRYAEEWANKLHVPVLDVYVPEALAVKR